MDRAPCGVFAVLVLASLATLGGANFLRIKPEHGSVMNMQVSLEDVRQALLEEIQGVIGETSHATADRLRVHEDALGPMVAALPKNHEGRLGHSTVRYALHRYFAQRHGWSVKGLDPAGKSFNESSPVGILQDRVPAYLQQIFEQRVGGRGLGAHELAALAATLEHLIYQDATQRLEAAYSALDLSVKAGNNEERVLDAIDTFMMMFVLGQDIRNMTKDEIHTERGSILEFYPDWSETRDFVRDVFRNVTGHAPATTGAFTAGQRTMNFEQAKHVIHAIQDQYGPWQARECHKLRGGLLKMEENNNGRVRLSDFYGQSSEDGWQFSESVSYLRALGALDESNPKKPRVLVANYLDGASNCLATTGFYSVCCISECEGMLGEIERQLAAPAALPREVAAIVAGIPSATVPAPRNLPAPLLRRLGEIAEHHDGKVPLHGRLFSQWLHHAFPRECPYPHAAGTTNPMTAEEWMETSDEDPIVSDEVRQEHADTKGSTVEEEDGEVDAVPWSRVEELVHTVQSPQPRAAASLRGALKWMCLLAVFVAITRSLPKSITDVLGSNPKETVLLPMTAKYHWA